MTSGSVHSEGRPCTPAQAVFVLDHGHTDTYVKLRMQMIALPMPCPPWIWLSAVGNSWRYSAAGFTACCRRHVWTNSAARKRPLLRRAATRRFTVHQVCCKGHVSATPRLDRRSQVWQLSVLLLYNCAFFRRISNFDVDILELLGIVPDVGLIISVFFGISPFW